MEHACVPDFQKTVTTIDIKRSTATYTVYIERISFLQTGLQTPTRLLQSLQEQVRVLRRAAEALTTAAPAPAGPASSEAKDASESDAAELQEQIVKLKGDFISKKKVPSCDD